jgi:glutaredoxin 3
MITVYSKSNCPFCDRAKALLESKGVAYTTVSIEEDQDARQHLLDMGLRSVPQIFNGTTIIPGGYQGLAGKDESFWTTLKG